MTKILFICHGNICRSPMAEYWMRKLLRKEGRSVAFEVASAATSREEIGSPVYPPAKRKLAERGVACGGHAARQLTRGDYDEYDLLIGMDAENLREMHRICGGDPADKMRLLLGDADHPRDVADPWYTRDFDAALRDIDEGCRALLEQI